MAKKKAKLSLWNQFDKQRNIPMFDNQIIYNFYWERLLEYALNAFEWLNLPQTVDAEFLEKALVETGCALFFKDEVLGYLSLRTTLNGQWNIYNIPVERRAYATNGYQNFKNIDNSVIIYNNYLRTPSLQLVQKYAYELYMCDSTILTNLGTLKTPIIMRANKDQKLTMENFQLLYESSVPVIRVTDDFQTQNFETLDLKTEFNVDKIYDLKQKIWDEALIMLGYSSGVMRKTGGENEIESLASYNQVHSSRLTYLNARKKACDLINTMFGLNIDVKFREIEINGNLYNTPADDYREREPDIT